MRQSQTAVLERGCPVEQELVTEPFEVAWAQEARWFVQFLREDPEAGIDVQVQVSPDGLRWVDHESAAVPGHGTTMITGAVHDLGHWFRLRIRGRAALVAVHLALKE